MPQLEQLSMVFSSQLFWLVVVFGIIFVAVRRGMLPGIRATVAAREKKIADDLEKANVAQEQANKAEEEWHARIEAARLESARSVQKAREESDRQIDARLRAALEGIDAKVEAARRRIWTSVQAARAEMEDVAVEAARQIVKDLTGMKVEEKEAAKAVSAELRRMNATAQPAPVERKAERVASGVR
jgi:F-type H+-transporting ATPase subunit b